MTQAFNIAFRLTFVVLIVVKAVFGNVPNPLSGRFCVVVSFLESLLSTVMPSQNDWRKWIEY